MQVRGDVVVVAQNEDVGVQPQGQRVPVKGLPQEADLRPFRLLSRFVGCCPFSRQVRRAHHPAPPVGIPPKRR